MREEEVVSLIERPSPTPQLIARLHDAEQIARDMGHEFVGVEHVLLATFRAARGVQIDVASQSLRGLLDPGDAVSAITAVMSAEPYASLASQPLDPDVGRRWGMLTEGDQ
ncbi:Clp protease N-terminal domain-containing protein [Nonomuraea sp. NPDC055795]